MAIKCVNWSFHNISIPVLEIDSIVYCTNEVLASALKMTTAGIRNAYIRHKKWFRLSDTKRVAKEIELQQSHKEHMGIKRVRSDLHLWSERDMLKMALITNTDLGLEFYEYVIDIMQANATKNCVSKTEYAKLENRLALMSERAEKTETDLANMQQTLNDCMPWLKEAASANGKALQAQKALKRLGDVN